MNPIEAQNEDTPKIDTNLNSLTKFIGAVISSGFSGIAKNTTIIKIEITKLFPNIFYYFEIL